VRERWRRIEQHTTGKEVRTMRVRTIITAVLLLFVGASVAYLIVGEKRARGMKTESRNGSVGAGAAVGEAADVSGKQPTDTTLQVVAFYFHGNTRCPTCRAIEAYTEEALRNGFANEFQTGKLVWLVVNIEEPGNEHYVDDYQLSTRSVVLVEMENGNEKKWQRLDNVWQLVRDKTAFTSYITDNAKAFLAGT
jgi:hypothetical protein